MTGRLTPPRSFIPGNDMAHEALKRNIPLLYAARLRGNPIFFVPVIFFQAQGLSMTQVMLLQTAFAAAVVALEVRSGFFADRVGRRPSILLGAVAGGGALVIALRRDRVV